MQLISEGLIMVDNKLSRWCGKSPSHCWLQKMGLALVAMYSTLVNFNHITLNYKRGKKLRRDNIDTSHRHSAAAITS